MSKMFKVERDHCGKEVKFGVDAVPELGVHIDSEVEDAASTVRADVHAEYYGHVDVSDIMRGARPLHELAKAIRAGDRQEAEYQLDRIAAEMGDDAVEMVQRARYAQPRSARIPDSHGISGEMA